MVPSVAAQMKEHGRRIFVFLSACPHSRRQVHLSCCYSVPSLALERHFLAFLYPLKTSISPGILQWQVGTVKASSLIDEQLPDSQTFQWETDFVGPPGPHPIRHANESPLIYECILSVLLF